jgi:hypothetical protein
VVPYYRGRTKHVYLPSNAPQPPRHALPPAIPQMGYHAPPFQPPAPQHQPTRLAVYPTTTHHISSHDRSGGSHRSANHKSRHPQRRGTSVPRNNSSAIENWARGATNLTRSNTLCAGSGTHRSGVSEGQDRGRRRDEGKKSRRGPVRPSPSDYESDDASRPKGRYAMPSPHPNKLWKEATVRKEPTVRQEPATRRRATARGSPSVLAHLPPITRRR